MSAPSDLPSGLVTFLFTDIEGSTRLAQLLGNGYAPVLVEHRRVLRESLLRVAEGAELFTEGDSMFLVFADAAAALAACAAAQLALVNHDWPAPQARPKVRMGLHTGYVEPRDGEYTSPVVHRAARVAAAAHGGQVLCSAATAVYADGLPDGASLLDLGLYRLRGFDDRERLFQLVTGGLERQFPRPRAPYSSPHNLPFPATSFIGRAAERAELHRLVVDHRLATVVGPGGSGKTRLAVETASELVDEYPDGVWLADLTSVTDPDQVPLRIAATLGLRPEPGRPIAQTLADHAASRHFLLLLDTCEGQLAAVAAVVNLLLGGGSGASVLATSREPIGLPGEVIWRIPPLSVRPGPAGVPSEAGALLLDRVEAARGGRAASPEEIRQLGRVAAAVDGVPLALELAAERLRVLSAGQLAVRIEDLLGTLDAGADATGHRPHRTIQSTVEPSYRSVDPASARLLRWLAAFAGPVELPALEWLFGGDPLGPLARLVDKSLIQVDPRVGDPSYRLLAPIRAFAAQRLTDAGEEDEARSRHVAWCLQEVLHTQAAAGGRAVAVSLNALDPFVDELRAALRWTSTGGSARQGLAVACGLDHWWRERGLTREGRDWLCRLYSRASATGEVIPDAELAAAYQMHAHQAAVNGEFQEQTTFSMRAEELAHRAGDTAVLARILAGRGAALAAAGDSAAAERTCRWVIRWAGDEGVTADALAAVYCLARILWQRGELDEAASLLATARPLAATRPAERGRRAIDMILGLVALSRDDLVAAHDHLVVALRSQLNHGFQARACETLNAFAVRCAVGGEPVTAARLFGATQVARDRLRLPAGWYGWYWAEQQLAAREALGDRAFDAAYADGGRSTFDGAVGLALAVVHPDLVAGSDRFAEADSRTL